MCLSSKTVGLLHMSVWKDYCLLDNGASYEILAKLNHYYTLTHAKVYEKHEDLIQKSIPIT